MWILRYVVFKSFLERQSSEFNSTNITLITYLNFLKFLELGKFLLDFLGVLCCSVMLKSPASIKSEQ